MLGNEKHKRSGLIGSKTVLEYYLRAICGMIAVSHEFIIPYLPELAELVKLACEHKERETQQFGFRLCTLVGDTLTMIDSLENRMYTDWENKLNDNNFHPWRNWGLFAEIDRHNTKSWHFPDLNVKYFQPTNQTTQGYQTFVNLILKEPLQKIDAFLNDQIQNS